MYERGKGRKEEEEEEKERETCGRIKRKSLQK